MTGLKTVASMVVAGSALALLAACTGGYALDERGVAVYPDPVVIEPGVVVTEPVPASRRVRRAAAWSYDIPEGHYPPPGSCRVWFPDRPAGQQPPPGPCNVHVPYGAVLIEG
jgi:hypothetical protein